MFNNTERNEINTQIRPKGRKPESLLEIYAFAKGPRELANLYVKNPKKYNKSVSVPFLNQNGKIDTGITTVGGAKTDRAFVALKAPGCQTRKKFRESGNCANCGFCVFSEHYSTGGSPVSPNQYQSQINFALSRPEVQKSKILEIFNSGSFFNDAEISSKAREKILKAIADKTKAGKILTVESKFSDLIGHYGKIDKALECYQYDGKKRNLEIAFGLETSDKAVGQNINKAVSQEKLEEIMRELTAREVRPIMYVLIKPDIMSESKAIEMAVDTIKNTARAAKKVRIQPHVMPHLSLSAVRVYEGSMLDAHEGYKTSKLWAVSEVIKRLIKEKIDGTHDTVFKYISFHIGLSDEDMPITKEGSPKNCGNCDIAVINSLKKFNGSMDKKVFLRSIKKAETCPCYQDWVKKLEEVPFEHISNIPEIQKQQIDMVMNTEAKTWPEGTRASRNKFESRAKVFPEGFFLAYESGLPVGISTSEIINYDPSRPINSWEDITNDGYITPNTNQKGDKIGHDPCGNSLYVVSVGVDPDFQKRSIGSKLVRAQQQLVQQKNLEYLVLGARVPSLERAKNKNHNLKPEDYIMSTGRDHLPVDHELRFYAKNGLAIHEMIPNYMEDDCESLNYGVVMIWKNPDFRP